jgi:hypothetical protein
MESINSSLFRANLAKLYRYVSLISKYLIADATLLDFSYMGLGNCALLGDCLVVFRLKMTGSLLAYMLESLTELFCMI